jgi:hypothetical protein
MRFPTRVLATLALAAAFATPVGALTLTLVPGQSSIVPEVGSGESLAGTLEIALGALPVSATTTLDLTDVSVTSSGGTTVALDPASPSPGLGVVNPAGAFLVPTLFLELTSGTASLALAIPNVTGTLAFGPGGASVIGLQSSFSVDSGTLAGILTVTLVAVPEPGTLALAGAGLLFLALRARTARRAAIR